MRYLILSFMLLMCLQQSTAQFLFPEAFVMIPVDTNRKYAGNVSGIFNSQTQRNVVNQYGVRSEFAHRIRKQHVITVAGSFDLITNGTQRVLSGGYLFTRFRNKISRRFFPEFMMQYQWFEVRGMEQKVAFTGNYRYRIVRNEKISLAAAAGVMMEYEKWGFTGVPSEKTATLANLDPVHIWGPRFNSYISYDHIINDNVELDIAAYYTIRMEPNEGRRRMGYHARVSFKITEHLSFRTFMRYMYDFQPVVPVPTYWYNFNNELVYTF